MKYEWACCSYEDIKFSTTPSIYYLPSGDNCHQLPCTYCALGPINLSLSCTLAEDSLIKVYKTGISAQDLVEELLTKQLLT